ncbi:MAG TPA: SWIM zinc finger family protein, partial [Polyangiaceae bacterium]|nr:SWIM zinc finger family protein [Polyangiaceae bacterium]
AVWRAVIEGLADKAQFAAELLAGQMPEAIDDVFRAAGASLFPEKRSDLATDCTCPDSGDPCKHVAATHFVLGEALDADPFLLFELRGRSKASVLAGIRAARAGIEPAPDAGIAAAPSEDASVPAVTLAAVAAEDYDRPRGAWPTLEFSFDAPSTPAAVLRQLGAPGAWRADASPAELLAPLVQRAADAARRIALGDPETSDATTEQPPRRQGAKKKKSRGKKK